MDARRSGVRDEAAKRRTEAAVAWLRDTFADARTRDASAVVIGFHANPRFDSPVADEYRQTYEPFLTALEEEVEQFAKPVLVAHGDGPRVHGRSSPRALHDRPATR